MHIACTALPVTPSVISENPFCKKTEISGFGWLTRHPSPWFLDSSLHWVEMVKFGEDAVENLNGESILKAMSCLLQCLASFEKDSMVSPEYPVRVKR